MQQEVEDNEQEDEGDEEKTQINSIENKQVL